MVLTGTVTGANPDGALLIQDDHGAPYTVWAGDVTLLDRAPSTHRDFQ
jgi:biotin-(acetyl-CoA carboxylase) ligase